VPIDRTNVSTRHVNSRVRMTDGEFACTIHGESAYGAGVHLCMREYVLHRHVNTSFVPLQSWYDGTREER